MLKPELPDTPESINFVPSRHKSYRLKGLTPGTQYKIEISVVVTNFANNDNQEGKNATLYTHTLLGPPLELRVVFK